MLSLASRRRLAQNTVRRMTSTATSSRRSNPSQNTPSDTNDDTFIDNPCWGSPTQCSLSHLIHKYSREKCILLDTPDYLVLNKPPDLRMDGNFPASVQKLLLYWYPPASIRDEKDDDLLENISQITTPPRDFELRHCHQLDYATSGVVLFARSRKAAHVAMESFAARNVRKVYLAIVHGSLQIDTTWPVLPKERLDVLHQQETLYRQERKKKRSDTFHGYLPPHSLFQKWKAHALKQRGENEKQSKRPKQEPDLNALWKQAVGDKVLTSDEVCQMASAASYKEIKRNDKWKQIMDQLTKLYNDANRQQQASADKSKSISTDLPKLFRIEGEADNAFYIFAPLADAQDDFAMRVKPGTLPANQNAFEGALYLDYKPSLTRCVILESTKGMTKVQLEPKTGRRHQLRVHMFVAGTAIVGDATYEVYQKKGKYPRMCLHAHTLSLPILGGTQLSATAPDPFPFDRDGDLIVEPELQNV